MSRLVLVGWSLVVVILHFWVMRWTFLPGCSCCLLVRGSSVGVCLDFEGLPPFLIDNVLILYLSIIPTLSSLQHIIVLIETATLITFLVRVIAFIHLLHTLIKHLISGSGKNLQSSCSCCSLLVVVWFDRILWHQILLDITRLCIFYLYIDFHLFKWLVRRLIRVVLVFIGLMILHMVLRHLLHHIVLFFLRILLVRVSILLELMTPSDNFFRTSIIDNSRFNFLSWWVLLWIKFEFIINFDYFFWWRYHTGCFETETLVDNFPLLF